MKPEDIEFVVRETGDGVLVLVPKFDTPDDVPPARSADDLPAQIEAWAILHAAHDTHDGHIRLPPVLERKEYGPGDTVTLGIMMSAYSQVIEDFTTSIATLLNPLIEDLIDGIQSLADGIPDVAAEELAVDEEGPDPRESRLPDHIVEARERRESQREINRKQTGRFPTDDS